MKYILSAIFIASMAFGACSSNASGGKENKPTETKTDSVPATASYVCPMHPNVKSDKAGQCSECGMDLEKK